jgi:hypothetical protein
MKRYTGQRALYEAISRTKTKSKRRSILERLLPVENKTQKVGQAVAPTAVEEPTPQVEEPVRASKSPIKESAAERASAPTMKAPVPAKAPSPTVHSAVAAEPPAPLPPSTKAWLRPRSVQLHDGRIEISLPYTIGVTAVLVAALVVLAAFRLGQRWSVAATVTPPTPAAATRQPARSIEPSASPAVPGASAQRAETARSEVSPASDNTAAAPAAQGDHIIVLAQCPQRRDLEPVQEYFTQKGVETFILETDKLGTYLTEQGLSASALGNRGGWLLFAGYYNNPQSPGTDGYAARMKIIDLGRDYKAPAGFGTFGATPFSDAYGMKIR